MTHEWSKYFDISSDYWKKVEKIYDENENYPKKVVKYRNLHHKFPKSFSKKDGVDIDNDNDNLVSLSLSDHFLVHYCLWKCSKKGYRNLMALAFNFMRKKAIKYASDETIEELAKDYANIMKDVSEMHHIVAKQVTSSKKWKEAMSKVDRVMVGKKAAATILKRYSKEELDETNKHKGDSSRGKTYEEIYGTEKAKELKESRSNSNRKRGRLSEETKKKISKANKGKKRSDETKKKLSALRKGRKLSDEDKRKKSLAAIGRKWYNNGNIQISIIGEPPEGFVPGMLKEKPKSDETRRKMSEAKKGKNGET